MSNYNADNLINSGTEVEMLSFEDAEPGVQVQLFTGLSLLYSLPFGGILGQTIIKKSGKNQDVEWAFPTPLVKINLSLTKETPDSYYFKLSNSYKLVGVFNSIGQNVLYSSIVESDGLKIMFEKSFAGYVIAIKLNNIEEIR